MMAIQYFWRHPLAEQVREEGRKEGLQQGLKQGLEQGRLQIRREMTIRVLEWRGIPVSDAVRERVGACTDLHRLELCVQRALYATDGAELFAGE
jgi:hypothetical protein